MGVVDGTPVDAATTNPAFLDAQADDAAQGRIDFVNTVPASGPSVINIQREVNSLDTFTGRLSGTAYNATPGWTNNQVGNPVDSLFARGNSLTGKFAGTGGHAHTGVDGDADQIAAATIASVPLKGYVIQGADLLAITGTSTDVSTELTGKVASNSSTVEGVVVNAPYNKIVLRQATGANQGDPFVNGSGDVVYGRLTYSSPTWTLSYYVLISNVETAYNFTVASDISWYYQELFNPMVNPPTYSEYNTIPSDNPTQDVVDATTTTKGKVQLATTVAAISGTGSAGTPNATVANADHTHEGVHQVQIDGDPTVAKGDVVFEAGSGITLSWDAGKLKIVSSGGTVGKQEIPSGTVDGVNPTFGPLTTVPADANSILVFVDVVPQVLGVNYTVSGSTITFQAGYIPVAGQTVYAFYLTGGTPSVPVLSGTQRTEYRTVTLGEATASALTLAYTPATPNYVCLDVIGGGPQFYGTDFSVTGTTLSWSGLDLDGVLVSGDRLRITYVT